MKILSARVRYFRTIQNEITVDFSNKSLAIVGPNNSGKTNILHSLRMFFTGYDNAYGYDRQNDLTFGVGNKKTSINVEFQFEGATDSSAINLYDQAKGLLNIVHANEDYKATIYLYFTDSSNPVYRLFPNNRRPAGTDGARYSRIEKDLVNLVISKFSCHYVSSNKSFEEIYSTLIIPYLRKNIASLIQPHITEIKNDLDQIAASITGSLHESGLDYLHASFSLPNIESEDFIQKFYMNLLDPHNTSVFSKGMGIQSAVILSSLLWVSQKENEVGINPLWLIEEPESFLHPQLSNKCMFLLNKMKEVSTLVYTTHSMSFVPQDIKLVVGTSLNDNKTAITSFRTFKEATHAIRVSLGIKFSDFFNFGKYNVFVEGKLDKEYIEAIIGLIPPEVYQWEALRNTNLVIDEFGGVKQLGGFLKGTYGFMYNETPIVIIFDGDDAGDGVRRELQGYFSNKNIPFQSNREYISIRNGFAIEGIFPDDWLIELYSQHQNWFDSYSVDFEGNLQPFLLKDNKKNNVKEWFLGKAREQEDIIWAERWILFLNIVNDCLINSENRINTI